MALSRLLSGLGGISPDDVNEQMDSKSPSSRSDVRDIEVEPAEVGRVGGADPSARWAKGARMVKIGFIHEES